jgi:hypothetical protein
MFQTGEHTWKKATKGKKLKSRHTPDPPPYNFDTEDSDNEERDEEPKKKKKDFESFNMGLRAQVIFEIIEEPEESDNDGRDDNENFSDNVSILNKILEINNKLNHHKRKELTYYIELGELLINLKLRYLKKCYRCVENDRLECLNCLSCSRMSASDIEQFYIDVKNVPFGQSYINLLISIRKLSKIYRKFEFFTCSMHELKEHISELRERMLTDKGFWS